MAKKGIIVPRRDGLVWEWLLNWSALDTAGTNNGTATNVTYTNTDRGYQNQAGVFNWTSSYISIADSSPLDLTTDYTLFARINMASLPSFWNLYAIIDKNSWWSWYEFELWNNSWTQTIFVSHWNAWTTTYSINYTLPTNTWVDLVVTFTWTTLTFYANSQVIWIVTWVTRIPATGASLLNIWRSPSLSSRFYSWKMQSVRIFNRALSQDEIQNWYLEWLRKLGGGSMSWLFDWLVAYYDMRGDANDIVGGNNGTVTGATLTTDRFGFANGAYSFNGTSNYITSALYFPTSYTMFIWVKCYSTTSTMRIMQNSNFSLTMNYPSTGKIEFSDWVNEWINSNGSSFNDNNWKCITTVCNNWQTNWSKVFNNWVFDSSGTISTSTSTWNTYIWTRSSLAQFYNWIIGEIFLFNTVKSDSEVKAIYDLSSKDYLISFL